MINKERLLAVAKELYSLHLVAATSGNVSMLLEDQQTFIITPSSTPYQTMTIDDLVVMDLSGEVVSGSLPPSSEWRMHQEIYLNRKDIKGIVHTHSPYATAFGVCYEKIPVVLIEMVPFIGGDVSVAPYVPAGSPGVGLGALESLQERKACLLGNHGVLAIGKTVEDALTTSIYLEDAAKIYHFSKSVGTPRILSEELLANR